MKIEYYNLYTHFVLITDHRLPLIQEKHRIRIEKYVTGIVNNNQSKLYSIYVNPEHMHFLASRCPGVSEEALATIISESSERFINANKLCVGNFRWQESGSAFSVSKSEVDKVCKYILRQPEHHKKVSFAEEYDSYIKYYETGLRLKAT